MDDGQEMVGDSGFGTQEYEREKDHVYKIPIQMQFEKFMMKYPPCESKELLDELEDVFKKHINSFSPYDGNEPHRMLKEKIRKASQDHNCNYCKGKILKGHYYWYGCADTPEGFKTEKICWGCLMDICSE